MGKLFDRALSAYSHADIDSQLKARFFLILCIVILATTLILTFLAGIIQYLNVGALVNSVIATLLAIAILMLFVLRLLIRGHFLTASHLLIIIVMTGVWIAMVVDPGEPVARLDSFVYIISLLGYCPSWSFTGANRSLRCMALSTLFFCSGLSISSGPNWRYPTMPSWIF